MGVVLALANAAADYTRMDMDAKENVENMFHSLAFLHPSVLQTDYLDKEDSQRAWASLKNFRKNTNLFEVACLYG